MRAFKPFLGFLREVLSENGVGSLSRTASAVLVAGYTYVMVSTKGIPEHTEQLAWVIAALYGANQLRQLGQRIVEARSDSAAWPRAHLAQVEYRSPTGNCVTL